MNILIYLFGTIFLILVIGKINYERQFAKSIRHLYSHTNDLSQQKFSYQQLENLPPPVQRFFKHVLKEGQPYIQSTRLIHDGNFKMGVGLIMSLLMDCPIKEQG